MNIGIFTDAYHPTVSGVVTSISMLEHMLRGKGHNVFIFTVSNPPLKKSVPNVIRMPGMPLRFSPENRLAIFFPPKTLLGVRRMKLDIIHTQTEFSLGIFGKVVSELFKIPMVHTYHTMYEDYTHYIAKGYLISKKTARRYSRLFCNRAEAVISPTEKTRGVLLSYGVRKPIHVIPTGIDFEPFSRERYDNDDILAVKREVGLNQTDPVIVFVGRLSKEKSIEVIINAMPKLNERLPEAKLLIVGGGSYLKELKHAAKKAGASKSILFAGEKPWADIGKYYQAGDLFVTASTTETQGLTYVEAMAAKVPVLAKKDDSIAGIIDHGITGHYFDKDEELPDMLYDILTNKEVASKIAENAFERIQYLSAEKFADNVERLYIDVIENSKHR